MAEPRPRRPRRRLSEEARLARDRDIVARYVVDRQTQSEIGKHHGLYQTKVSQILAEYGVGIDPIERIAHHTRKRWDEGRLHGRPKGSTVWPDCPPEIARIYDKLGRHFGKGEARRLLEEPRR